MSEKAESLCPCGQRPVENPQNLWKTRDENEQVFPPIPPLSRKDLFLIAREEIRDLQQLVAALIDANDLLKADLDDLRAQLTARGLIR